MISSWWVAPSGPSQKCANRASHVAPAVVSALVKVKARALHAMVSATTVHALHSNAVRMVPPATIVVHKAHVKPARKATASPAVVDDPNSVARVHRSSSNGRAPSAVIVRSSKVSVKVPLARPIMPP